MSGLVSWSHRKVRYGLAPASSFQWQRDENPYGAPLSILRTELVVMRMSATAMINAMTSTTIASFLYFFTYVGSNSTI